MASTYSAALRLELMGTGDQSGTWGTTTNTNLGTLLEQAITGVLSVAQGDVANMTLTTVNGGSDQARNAVVILTGALTQARNVVVPTANKLYLIKNSTSGGFALTVKTSGGTGVDVAAGTSRWVYCDGTNVVDGLVGTMAAQLASAVAITGGTISGISSLGATAATITTATITTLTATTIELGATDTTLARAAAGVVSVEGNVVPSPASQASGDILYRGASSWSRLAKGTAAQVLTMNAGATAPEWAAVGSAFAASTKMLFVQTAAPTGWTKQVDQNDKALRLISGTVGTGGSSPFSTVFAKTATDSHTLTATEVPNNNLTLMVEDFNEESVAGSGHTGSAASGHTHNMDIRVQYVDVIYASKD